MNRQIITILILFLPTLCFSQKRISGIVKDAQTGELLIGASVYVLNTNNGTTTNSNGYFSLLCNDKSVNVSFIGYKKQAFNCNRDTIVTILLEPGQEIDEVKVSTQSYGKFNTTILSVSQLKRIPAIGGKPDVLKTLQLMPGIQSQGEGTSLINVRGGNPGENLYLIDDVQLLYVNHLGGFMSVFNPDMINSMEVYKGGFPAKYGGKLSSVMAINQREGNNKKWMGNIGLGITDVSFSVEGPLLDNKASLIITGRKTLTEALFLSSALLGNTSHIMYYGFHDINGKFTYRPNTKNSFHLNFYQGDDYLVDSSSKKGEGRIKVRNTNIWGNWLLSGRWSRVVSSRLFVNNILSTTNYRLKLNLDSESNIAGDTLVFDSKYESKVKNLSARSDWQYKATSFYNLDFGFKLDRYDHIPNQIYHTDEGENDYEQIISTEGAVYISNKIELFKTIEADIGIRAISYTNESYTRNEIEPRVSINARLFPYQSVNLTYQKVNQFAHLLLTSGSILNNEIWVPSDKRLDPSNSIQYSVGWKGSFLKGRYDAELNVYYKDLNNLATYKEGYSNLLGDGGWRSKIETGGEGKSEGIEFLIRRNSGEWTGFLGYGYSQTTRQFDGINRGEEFVFDYDSPHSVSINISRRFSEKWSGSLTWIYQTGLPYTPVLGRQYVSEYVPGWTYDFGREGYKEVLVYGERNSDRMEDYHRLDLGFIYNKTTKHGRKAEWNFSVYNAYNRLNPIAYYYAPDSGSNNMYDTKGYYHHYNKYKISFLPLVPTVSYKLYFEQNTDDNESVKKSVLKNISNFLSND